MISLGLLLSLALLLCYTAFLAYGLIGLSKLRNSNILSAEESPSLIDVSVIVPFRNEIDHLKSLLISLSDQIYLRGKLEFVLVDDHSNDGSTELVRSMIQSDDRFRLLVLPEGHEGKKSALEYGIAQSSGSFILITDADSSHERHWIHTMTESLRIHKAAMVIGAVAIDDRNTFTGRIQNAEFLSIQFITAALAGNNSSALCNGANLGFERKHFLQVSGFKGHRHLASGDDVFLLRSFRNKGFPITFSFSPASLVKTTPQKNFRSFLFQRLRWASKVFQFADGMSLFAAFILTMTTLLPLSMVFLALREESLSYLYSILIAFKLILDFYCVHVISRAYGISFHPLATFMAWIFQPIYIAMCLLILPFFKPTWKGRPIVSKS